MCADTKISALTELAEAPAPSDEFVGVDKSDTTMAASGTDKRVQYKYLVPQDGWYPAGETYTFGAADSPSFTVTITGDLTTKYSAGMRVKLTHSATTKYFIITKVAYSAPDTTLTLYGGTDYTLSAGAITSPFFSTHKAPLGFPLDPTKWTVETTDVTSRSQASPVSGTWYNLGTVNIVLPIGAWDTYYQTVGGPSRAAAGDKSQYVTLSTANNSESDTDFTSHGRNDGGTFFYQEFYRRKTVVVSAKTTYYLNTKTASASMTAIENRNDQSKLIIRAVSAYL